MGSCIWSVMYLNLLLPPWDPFTIDRSIDHNSGFLQGSNTHWNPKARSNVTCPSYPYVVQPACFFHNALGLCLLIRQEYCLLLFCSQVRNQQLTQDRHGNVFAYPVVNYVLYITVVTSALLPSHNPVILSFATNVRVHACSLQAPWGFTSCVQWSGLQSRKMYAEIN